LRSKRTRCDDDDFVIVFATPARRNQLQAVYIPLASEQRSAYPCNILISMARVPIVAFDLAVAGVCLARRQRRGSR
jgi:hypothetical protein